MSTAPALLISADNALSEEIRAVAAVAGWDCVHRADPAQVGELWQTAPLVLLDGRSAIGAAEANVPRRAGVVVVRTAESPDCWRAAFQLGAERVVSLPGESPALVELLDATTENTRVRTGRVLAVLGGCGGAGTSVFATATAFAAARSSGRALLVDGDPLGGGLDLLAGFEDVEGVRWSGLRGTDGWISASSLRDELPTRSASGGELALLSVGRDGPGAAMTPEAIRAVIDAGRREGSTVVCDLPRALSEVSTAVLSRADATVLVVPAHVRACAAASRTVAALRDVLGPVRAVVRGPAPGGLSSGDVHEAVGVDVLTVMRPQPGLADVVDRCGLAGVRQHGPLWRAARDVLAWLATSTPQLAGAA